MPSTSPRRLNRREFLRLAGTAGLAAVAVPALAACQQAAPDPVPEVPVSTSVPGEELGGTVRWAECYSALTTEEQARLQIDAQAYRDWLARVAQQFEAEHPGWRVELESVPYDPKGRYLAYDYNVGVPHDLVLCSAQYVQRHRWLGTLLDLSPYISQLSQSERDDLCWSAVWQASAAGGLPVALPMGLDVHAHVYNRPLFREAGLNPDTPFQNPDDLLSAAKKLTRPGGAPWGLALYVGTEPAMVEQVYAPLVWHFGGNIYNEVEGQATLVDDAGLRAASWLADLVRRQGVVPPGTSGTGEKTPASAVLEPFVQGKAAQAWGFGSYWLPELQRSGLVTACLPASKGCQAEQAGVMTIPTSGHAQFVGGHSLALYRLSQQPQMAFALLQVALRPANLRTCPDAGLPARLSAWRAAEYSAPFYQTWLAAARNGRAMPATPFYGELLSSLTDALLHILTDNSDIKESLQTAEDHWNSRYARA